MTSQKLISIWARAFTAAAGGKTPAEQTRIINKLFEILKAKKKTYLLPKILARAENYFSRENKIKVSLARHHQEKVISGLKEKLLEVFGKNKEVEIERDENLIAGFRAETGNYLVKASLKDFLNLLKDSLR